jgi:hypothetical protein
MYLNNLETQASAQDRRPKMPNTSSIHIPVIDLTGDDDVNVTESSTKPSMSPHRRNAKRKRSPDSGTMSSGLATKPQRGEPKIDDEKRLKRFRSMPTNDYNQLRYRALTQRMFVMDRKRQDTANGHPIETITLAGTTGNVYTIIIDKVPTCDCPHARKGNQQCKHIIYVLSRVLKVRPELEYQLAFCSFELREIFEGAPPLPNEQVADSDDCHRRPTDGECPICCDDLVSEQSKDELVWCRSGCGNNLHKTCFAQWAATKCGQMVTCPFCRKPWESDADVHGILKAGTVNAEGYKNVAGRFGLSGVRDESTYSPWARMGSWQTDRSKYGPRWGSRRW